MSARADATVQPVVLRAYRSPQTVLAHFVARRTLKSAVLWAFIFGCYSASKTIGFAQAAPTAAARAKILQSFGNNAGLNALLGVPHNITTIAGYAAWNTFSVVTIIGSIWAFLLATRYFRGEEETGRTELLLAGQTTGRRAATDTLIGLGASLCVQYVVVAVLFVLIGSLPSIGFSPQNGLFFALAVVMGTTLFISVGALTSQLMPTRSRAASLAAVVFGICFFLRALADVSTSARWLLDVTPLGWIERLRPLTGSQPIWLLPIIGLTLLCAAGAVYLAGRRDLGDSIFADQDTARPRTKLLNSTFGATLRLTRGSTIGWLAAIVLSGAFYGLLTKTAAQAIGSLTKHGTGKLLHGLAHSAQLTTEMLFLGIIFLILTPLAMCYAANAVAKIRDEEAQGYVDNFLVRRVSRWRWLGERTLVIALAAAAASVLAGIGVWVGEASQHCGVAFHLLLLAGLNMLGAVIFTLGVGILAIGVVPRLASVVTYSVIGWSFLMYILGSGLHLNHWLLDTSVLQHLKLAPAVQPDWTANAVLAALGVLCYLIGSAIFNARDLASE